MSNIRIDVKSRTPIFEQLCAGIREEILSGAMAPGEALPSVRSLACELAINPNTIQKAYAELERQKLISSAPGRGSFVSDDIRPAMGAFEERILEDLRAAVHRARLCSIEKKKLTDLIDKEWEGTKQ